MQQHSKAIGGWMAARPSSFEERRFERHIHKVGDNRTAAQRPKINVERGLTPHVE
jgi:ABC-type xylose transport system permease subunit